jgi:hypothetical protein
MMGIFKFLGNLVTGGLFGAVSDLFSQGLSSITGIIKRKQDLKEAINNNKIRMAESTQEHNQNWEMRSLENAGWKDEVLFFAIVGMYVYSAVDPDGAAVVFENWDEAIPEWFQTITMWMIASILGVKKIGDYLPGVISGIRTAMGKK